MRYLLDEGNTALWVSSAAIVVWVIQYSKLAPWWRNFIGISIVGLAVCLLLVYIPSLLALAWPAQFAHFATARWYTWLAIIIVNLTALFMVTRIVTWDYIRRQRNGAKSVLLPSEWAVQVAELQAEVERLRERLGENGLTQA